MNGTENFLKQAHQLQAKLAEIQEQLAAKTVEASAGGGMVTVVVNGRMEVISLRIDPAVAEAKDKDMLEDLVRAAVNEGIRKAQQMVAAEMGKMAGNLKIGR